MLAFLFIFLSFAQVGFLGLGGNAGSQALLEHELLTLHHWLTPEQLGDLMVFCRTLPGGTGLNAAVLSGSAASAATYGFWGSVAASLTAVAGLVVPSFFWTAIIDRLEQKQTYKRLLDCVLTLLRPLVPGLIAAAALLMMRSDNFGSPSLSPWDFWVSVFLFVSTLLGVAVFRFHAAFMVLLCGIAGWILF